MIKVVNKHYHRATNHDIAIHRGTALGNVFSHLPNSRAKYQVETRDEAVDRFEVYINEMIRVKDPKICFALNEIYRAALRGNVNLVCFCRPARCHGEVIQKIIEKKIVEHHNKKVTA